MKGKGQDSNVRKDRAGIPVFKRKGLGILMLEKKRARNPMLERVGPEFQC